MYESPQPLVWLTSVQKNRLLRVALRVVKTPVVFMTFFGLAANFACDHKLPNFINAPLVLLANAFSPG